MTTELKPVSGIDHGTPPPAVLQQQERLKAVLQSDGPPETSTASGVSSNGEHEDTGADIVGSLRLIRGLPFPQPPTDRVALQFIPETAGSPAFKLEFDVVEVCVKEYYISLLVASDLGFEPAGTMRFRLKHKDQEFPVIFAGAEFEFKTINARGISFLRDKDAEAKANKND